MNFDKNAKTELSAIEQSTNVDLYPNPTSGLLNLNVEQKDYVQRLEVFTISGETVFDKFQAQVKTVSLNLEHLNSGMYFLKVYFDYGSVEVKKFSILK